MLIFLAARIMALISDERKYSLFLVDGFFGGGEKNFAENGSWAVIWNLSYHQPDNRR